MTDAAALLTDIFRRNAMRRTAGLPLLDVRRELALVTALDAERAFRQLTEQFAADRNEIEREVQTDLCQQYGDEFVKTKGGRWALTREVDRRFRKHLAIIRGVEQPMIAGRHRVIYGGG